MAGARRCCRRAPLSIRRPVSRVLYGAIRERTARDGHSSGTPVARRLRQPTRTAGSGHRSRGFLPAPSLFGFAPGGVCHAASVAGNAVRSYRTFSPLPRLNATRRGGLLLCGTFPGVAPAGRYPAPYVHGARTFLPGHLSVIAGAAVQPTDPASDGHTTAKRQGQKGTRRRRVDLGLTRPYPRNSGYFKQSRKQIAAAGRCHGQRHRILPFGK